MAVIELEALRAELARKALASNDEGLLKKALNLFKSSEEKVSSKISGLTYSNEERLLHLQEDFAEYKAGKADLKSHEDFLEEMEEWQ